MTKAELLQRARRDGRTLISTCQASASELMPFYLSQAKEIGWDQAVAEFEIGLEFDRGLAESPIPSKEGLLENQRALEAFLREICAEQGLDAGELLEEARRSVYDA